MIQEFVTFFSPWNFGLRTALGDFSWWASSWHCTVNLPTFGQAEQDGRSWKRKHVWVRTPTMCVETCRASSVQGCGFPHPFLAWRMLSLASFVPWKSLKADGSLERRKEFPCNGWIPCALYIFSLFTTSLPRRYSYSHFVDWKTET